MSPQVLPAPRRAVARVKPEPPRRNFPLTAHRNGQWCKKIKGTVRMFGVWEDPAGAESLYLQERDDWEAGRDPRKSQRPGPGAVSLFEVCDRWMTMRKHLTKLARAQGGIGVTTYFDSKRAIDKLRAIMGDNANPLDWWPEDFAKLRAKLAHAVGPSAVYQYVTHIRSMLRWAAENGILDRPVRWGDEFSPPSASEKREARFDFEKQNGERRFELAQARELLKAVDKRVSEAPGNWGGFAQQKMVRGSRLLRACTYIAANTGAYGADIASLTHEDVDLREGLILTKRTKTAVLWQATLWRVTVEAIRAYLEVGPQPNSAALEAWRQARARNTVRPEDREAALKAEPLFLTATGYPIVREKIEHDDRGNPVKGAKNNAIGWAFAKLLDELGMKQPGLSFGAWRHTFRSLAADALGIGSATDVHRLDAVNRIMAHKIAGSADTYVKLRPEQLRLVTDAVYRALWPDAAAEGSRSRQGLRLVS